MIMERWRQIESLFHAAYEKAGGERERFLEAACGSDQALRREVESLLANEELASGFLESDTGASTRTATRVLVPQGEQIGPYTILEILGAGGMGEVYKAYDRRLDRHVAIKFLLCARTDDRARLARFHHEARAASALNHPNICTVYDVGEHKGRPFLVIELLEGHSLRDHIAGKPLPGSELPNVLRQLCAALKAAHAKNIVHRDIKPANIFVTHGGQVKILDFGLAKRGGESLHFTGSTDGSACGTHTLCVTTTGSAVGTLAYMSPEQAVGREVDARSDIFSLGVVLYEMATGQRPFRGKTPAGILVYCL